MKMINLPRHHMAKRRLGFGVALLFSLLIIFPLASCQKIQIRQDNYVPTLDNQYSVFQKQAVYLAPVQNRAENTSIWYYYDSNRSLTYETWPNLASYFWYCFQKAFLKIGMNVYEHDWPQGVPELYLSLLSITDKEFIYQVELAKNGGKVFLKRYSVNEDLSDGNLNNSLESRAYGMVNKMVKTILLDQEFKKIFMDISENNQ